MSFTTTNICFHKKSLYGLTKVRPFLFLKNTMEIQPIINTVAQKAIISLDLEDLFPKPEDIRSIDIKDFLYKALLLKEAEFRAQVKATDWSQYNRQYVTVFCSTQAIVPMWAYMIISAELAAYAKDVVCAPPAHAADVLLYRNIARLDMSQYENQRVVVKGCGERQVPEAAYVQIAQQLAKVARAVSFGEPCSMVPVFKKTV